MNKYTVIVKRTITQCYTTIVDAPNDMAAWDKVEAQADKGEIDFNAGSSEIGEPELVDVQRL